MNESTELIDADAGDGEPADDLMHGVLYIDASVYGYPKALARYREEPHLIGTTLYRCEVKLGPGAKWRPFVFDPDAHSRLCKSVFSREDEMTAYLDAVLTHLRTPRPNPTRWQLHAPHADATEADDVEAE